MRKHLKPLDTALLNVLTKHPRGVGRSTIDRELKGDGLELFAIPRRLCNDGFVIKKFQFTKLKGRRRRRRLVYHLNPLLRTYMKYYMSITNYLPFIERSSTAWIQEKRWSTVNPDIKLRMAYRAIELLQQKKKLVVKPISEADSTIERASNYLVARRDSILLRPETTCFVRKTILESRNNVEIPAYAFEKENETVGYFIPTRWGFHSLINRQFCQFLHHVTKTRFGSKKTSVEKLRRDISDLSGIQYPKEAVIAACFLQQYLGDPLNVDVSFKGYITIEKPVIGESRATLPRDVMLYAQPQICEHSFGPPDYVSFGGEIKAVRKTCLKCGFTVRESV
jgi:hypothetical protein